jgi:hypothetical protein
MAPEQLEPGQEQHDARTDVYQIGLILYEMLTLERAYTADAVREIARYVQLARAGLVRAVRDVDSRADVGLAAVIGRALAPKPEDRYARLEDLTADLRRVAAGRAPRLAPTPLVHRARCAAQATARGPAGIALLAAAILIPVVWTVRAGFLQTVTSVKGWGFSPEKSKQFDLDSESLVRVGDDLGIRVSNTKPTIVYVLSVFGDAQGDQRLVKPMPPTPLVNGVPQPRQDSRWGVRLEAGTHELICTRIEEENPREGLLVFATPERLETLERWLEALEERSSAMGLGVEQGVAFALLDEIREPAGVRGAVLAAGAQESDGRIARERERYSGLSASKAAGKEDWDLGQRLIRYEVLCTVVPE